MKPSRAWERMPEETPRAYAAFEVYVRLGPQRSLQKVSRELGKSAAFLSRWSSKYSWVERSRCYDDEERERQCQLRLAAEASEAHKRAARMKDLREEEFVVGTKLIEKAKAMLAVPHVQVKKEEETEQLPDGKTLVRKITIIQPARWNFVEAARIVEVASKLIRLSLGMCVDGREFGQACREHAFKAENGADELTDAELEVIIRRGYPRLSHECPA